MLMVPVWSRKHPAFVMDANSRIFLFRTAQFSWLKEEEESFYQAVRKLLDGALSSEDIRRKSAKGVRGPHFPCIIGHHREYAVVGFELCQSDPMCGALLSSFSHLCRNPTLQNGIGTIKKRQKSSSATHSSKRSRKLVAFLSTQYTFPQS
jgi:hypothetical protein